MIETLNNLQPVLIVFLLFSFYLAETFIPYLTKHQNRARHARRNITLVLIAVVTSALTAAWLTWWLSVIQKNHWGLLNMLGTGKITAALVGVLLIDLTDYPYHLITHKIPLLWRYHRVHHSDHELDSTSSMRFHPFEVLAQGAWQTCTFVLLGIPFAALVLYFTIYTPLLFIQHSNIKFPAWVEKPLTYIFSMSAFHKIHHTDEQYYTDSNYGDIFTFWDRIFGTYRNPANLENLKWGLKEFKHDEHQTVVSQLLLPFKHVEKK